MRDTELYRQLLGLASPWTVTRVELAVKEQRVDVWTGHPEGERWPCPECGALLPLYDHTEEREWRHLVSTITRKCSILNLPGNLARQLLLEPWRPGQSGSPHERSGRQKGRAANSAPREAQLPVQSRARRPSLRVASSRPKFPRFYMSRNNLDSCQFKTYLHARPPRVQCGEHGVRQVRLPWAEAWARFTTLFERLAIDVLLETDVLGAARILGITWAEAWHIQERAVRRGQQAKAPRVVTQVGVDEKAAAKGHRYITLVCDLKEATVEFIAG